MSKPSNTTPPRGSIRVALLAGIAVVGLALCALLTGCATSDSGGTLQLQLRDDPAHPAPACLYVLSVDGRTLHKGSVDTCPVVPACKVTP